MPTWKSRSTATRARVMATTGVPRIWMRLVAYIAQRNSGMRNQVMPGARILWMVTTKFRPVRIEEKPAMNTPSAADMHVGVEVSRAQRRVERPAGIHAAPDYGIHGQGAAHHEDVPAQQVELGESQVAGADHHRYQKISKYRRNGRNQEEEHHDDAVHAEQLVVGSQAQRSRHWAQSGGCRISTAAMPPSKKNKVIETR